MPKCVEGAPAAAFARRLDLGSEARERVRPQGRDMKDLVRTSTGAVWREAETVSEAMAIGKATRTAFGHFFQHHRYNRYFVLGADFHVIGCVPREHARFSSRLAPAPGLPLFVGYMKGNPLARYGREIGELARTLGVEIAPAHCPYRGNPGVVLEDGTAKKLSRHGVLPSNVKRHAT